MKVSKKDLFEFIFLLLISLTIVSLFSMDHLNEDNCNYAIEEIHHFNNKIFNENINTIGNEFSPRYYANSIISYFMRFFDLNWFESSFIFIKINYVLYALVATVASIKFFKKNRALASLLISLYLMIRWPLLSVAFELNYAFDIFLGTAIPLSYLGLISVLGKNKYWEIGWILILVATFLHIHEGFWGAFLLGVIWLATCFSDKKINFKVLVYIIIYLLFLILLIAPTLKNSKYIDGNYFSQIYVYMRLPHHLLLSFIGKERIIKGTLLLFFINFILLLELLKCKKNKSNKQAVLNIYFFSIAYILMYGTHYISTEILKIPFIITMYIPKVFKFFVFMSILTYIILGLRRLGRGKILRGTIFLIIPLILDMSTSNTTYSILLIFLLSFLILEKKNLNLFFFKNKHLKIIINIFIYLLVFFLIYKKYFYLYDQLKFLYIGILIFEFISPYIKNIKIKKITFFVVFILLTISFFNSMKGKFYNVTEEGYQCISGLEYAQKATDLELYELAIQFKNITNLDEGFLADPYAVYPNYFQLFSERNCYVLYKNTPSQKHLVIEWYEKIEKVKNVSEVSAERLKELLKDINLKYILISADKFDVVKDSQYFDEIIKNNKYGIFRLKEDIE